jgi:L,D-peptidoglycan transpeptidase YkuD (ErfK/YbiS/YcfS/YnhG family)
VPTATSTVGELQTWRWSANKQEYVSVLGPVRAYVGSQGVGRASESRSRTPAGVFTLTEAFGRLPNPGTDLPYRKVGLSAWWVSDVDSPLYNTFQRCRPGADCGFSQAASEQLGAISVYSHAVVIDYNRDPVRPGRGSAFFLHVTDGRPTAGCVAIDSRALVRVMRWLKPQAEPVISIGVGDAAFEVLKT